MKESTKKFLKGLAEMDAPEEVVDIFADAMTEIEKDNLHPYNSEYVANMNLACFKAGYAFGKYTKIQEDK